MKFENDPIETLTSVLNQCSESLFGEPKSPKDFVVKMMFPKLWYDSNMGFPQNKNVDIDERPTKAYTCVVEEIETGRMVVFVDKRFAYAVNRPNKMFFKDLYGRCLISARKYNNQYEFEFNETN